jgi:hypothetical protein
MAFRHTPAEHRQMAKKLRSYIGNPRAYSPERLEQMARNHEVMAAVREGQAIFAMAGGYNVRLKKSPSIIPGSSELPPKPRAKKLRVKKPPAFQLRFPGM